MLQKNLFGILTSLLAVMLIFSFAACTKSGGSNSGGRIFTDVTKVEDWLASQKGGASPDDPIPFRVRLNLQNMASPESNWQKLLTSINTAGLYVALDLSGCTMPNTEFNADGGTRTGKQFIVSLVLPDSTESVAGGTSFTGFSNLKNMRARNTDYYLIGSHGPAGGIIFYNKGEYSDGWRYLEAAPEDMATRLRWVAESYGGWDNWANFPSITGTETGIGTGKQNTNLILATDANAPAAKTCKDLYTGGKNDWFLPSLDELDLMYQNLKVNNIGGFGDNYYWSSSQRSSYESYVGYGAWDQYFGNGSQDYHRTKSYGGSVRAVRAF